MYPINHELDWIQEDLRMERIANEWLRKEKERLLQLLQEVSEECQNGRGKLPYTILEKIKATLDNLNA